MTALTSIPGRGYWIRGARLAVEHHEHSDAAADEHRAPESREKASAPTVYVVDPDKAVRDSLEKFFRLQKFSVRSFSSAEGFLESYNGNRAACLIIEFDLPGLSGLELLETLPGRGIDLPAIVLSGQGNVPNAVRALRAGAVDFIEKPVVPHVLVRQVREAVRQARPVREDSSDSDSR
jgi:FixJ family two-component response regulator